MAILLVASRRGQDRKNIRLAGLPSPSPVKTLNQHISFMHMN